MAICGISFNSQTVATERPADLVATKLKYRCLRKVGMEVRRVRRSLAAAGG
jgi:hypothetical protein